MKRIIILIMVLSCSLWNCSVLAAPVNQVVDSTELSQCKVATPLTPEELRTGKLKFGDQQCADKYSTCPDTSTCCGGIPGDPPGTTPVVKSRCCPYANATCCKKATGEFAGKCCAPGWTCTGDGAACVR